MPPAGADTNCASLPFCQSQERAEQAVHSAQPARKSWADQVDDAFGEWVD